MAVIDPTVLKRLPIILGEAHMLIMGGEYYHEDDVKELCDDLERYAVLIESMPND